MPRLDLQIHAENIDSQPDLVAVPDKTSARNHTMILAAGDFERIAL
jgi:hypothetical protein